MFKFIKDKINRNLFILVMTRIFQVVIMLVGIRLSTSLLSPSEMGKYYLLISIASFVIIFFVSSTGQYLVRNLYIWHKEKQLINKLFNYNIYLLLISLISAYILFVLSYYHIIKDSNFLFASLLIPMYIFFISWNQTIIPMINLLDYKVLFGVLTIFTSFLSVLMSYFMVKIFGLYGELWITGQVLAAGLIAIVAILYLMNKIKNKFSIVAAFSSITMENGKRIFSFSFPIAIAVGFLWVQNQSYKIIIGDTIGLEFLGYFGVGIGVAIAISSSCESIVHQFFYPQVFKVINDERQFKSTYLNTLNVIIPIYFFIAFFVSIIAIYLITVLVDKKYSSSYVYIIYGIWIEFFRMSSNYLTIIAQAKMNNKTTILPYAIGGFVVIIGVYFSSFSENFSIYIPLILILGSFVTFFTMLIAMNKLMTITYTLSWVKYILPYIIVFFIALLFHNYSNNIIYSLIIIILFGLYLLFIIHKFLRIRENV